MKFEWFITRRYLKSRPKRRFLSVIALISIAGVALGVMTLIVVLGVMSGFSGYLLNKIMGTESHLLVSGSREGIGKYSEIIPTLERMEHVVAASPVITNLVMLRSDEGAAAVFIKGIDLEREKKATDLGEYLRECTPGPIKNKSVNFAGDASLRGPGLGGEGILIGRELARSLGVGLGDKVTVIAPSLMAELTDWTVNGLFRSGYYEYDSSLAYISLPSAQRLFGLGDIATGIQVRLDKPYLAPQVSRQIEAQLGLPAKPWMQFKPNLFSALKLEKSVQFIIIVLIVVVAAFNIISILDMIVTEKTKDIGILKSIGATAGSIKTVFILQGLAIGLVGTAIGCGLGLLLCYLLKTYDIIKLPANIYYLSTIPVEVKGGDFIYIISTAIVLTFLATLYPAWRASRLDPVEALRYE
ncbi:FtsX-like permease family protein [bacterium]|nr:FtsX-like permease family protein [bacterium]